MNTVDLKEVPKQRMYHITTFYLSGIHAGIQSYHAGMEYALKYWETPEFQRWVQIDKTVIVLAGGDTNSMMNDHYNNELYVGGMQNVVEQLYNFGKVPYAKFFEPGVNNAMTSLALLVDETVWDKINHPDPTEYDSRKPYNDEIYNKRMLDKGIEYAELCDMYGEKTAFLRQFLKQFQLAK